MNWLQSGDYQRCPDQPCKETRRSRNSRNSSRAFRSRKPEVCRINVDKILVDIASNNDSPAEDSYSIDIPIGNYFNYSVYPTCGLSTTDNLIGEVDDPRYFAHPSHVDAKILWFGRGFIDYRIPNMLPPGQKIDRLTLSFEISSEAPGVNNDWPSDISFFLNNTKVGSWTSPGDFGDVHGMFTPDWWFPNWNQYGLLKMLVIDRHGTFIDGLKISDVNTQQLTFTSQDDMVFRFQVDEPSQNIGGLTLFGKDFGNYNQDINVKCIILQMYNFTEYLKTVKARNRCVLPHSSLLLFYIPSDFPVIPHASRLSSGFLRGCPCIIRHCCQCCQRSHRCNFTVQRISTVSSLRALILSRTQPSSRPSLQTSSSIFASSKMW